MSAPKNDFDAPAVHDRVVRPPGLLPKHTQPWLVGGLALAMVLVIAFSGSQSRPGPSGTDSTEAAARSVTQARIDEYRARIDEQAKKLADEQARLTQVRQTADGVGVTPPESMPTPDAMSTSPSGGPAYGPSPLSQVRLDLAAAQLRREYEASSASNLVVRRAVPVEGGAPEPSGGGEGSSAPEMPPTASDAGPTYRLFEGTILETVLANRLDGSFSGPVKCLVTTPVFSPDRLRLLIPQGTEVLGQVRQVEALGQQRLSVTFHRLIRPDGQSVTLQAPGLDQRGETGLRDKVNHHYAQIFGVSLAIGAIAGLSQANTSYGANASSGDVYRQGVATSLSQSSMNVLDRFLNVLPTFTIREGARVKVFLTADIDLPAYHAGPSTYSGRRP